MKTYILIFTDRKGNELLREKTDAENITEARKFADKKLSNSLINDLYKNYCQDGFLPYLHPLQEWRFEYRDEYGRSL